MSRGNFIKGLRDMADFFEQHPDVIAPKWPQDITLFATTPESSKAEMAAIARAMGSAEKSYDNDLFSLTKPFGELLFLRGMAHRDSVCERVVVGEKVIPATEERVIPAQPETVEEIVEWRCAPLLEVAHV